MTQQLDPQPDQTTEESFLLNQESEIEGNLTLETESQLPDKVLLSEVEEITGGRILIDPELIDKFGYAEVNLKALKRVMAIVGLDRIEMIQTPEDTEAFITDEVLRTGESEDGELLKRRTFSLKVLVDEATNSPIELNKLLKKSIGKAAVKFGFSGDPITLNEMKLEIFEAAELVTIITSILLLSLNVAELIEPFNRTAHNTYVTLICICGILIGVTEVMKSLNNDKKKKVKDDEIILDKSDYRTQMWLALKGSLNNLTSTYISAPGHDDYSPFEM